MEPEERQARLVRALRDRARVRSAAVRAERDATAALRREVVAALEAGMTTRRAAELADVSLDTVNRWSRAGGGPPGG